MTAVDSAALMMLSEPPTDVGPATEGASVSIVKGTDGLLDTLPYASVAETTSA